MLSFAEAPPSPLTPLVPLVFDMEVEVLGVPLVAGVAEGMVESCRRALCELDGICELQKLSV